MRTLETLSLAALLGLSWATSATAQSISTAHAGGAATSATALAPSLQGKPVVARIHADWCAACKATNGTMDAIKAKYGRSIAFVEFDVTDGKTSAAAAAQAKRLGLTGFFEANKTATSTVAIVNPKTGTIVAKLYADPTAGDYDAAIGRVAAQLRK
ncbi:MAG: hypothetical protein NVS3B7_17090 [Candidatus Elarobacter sp.]